MKTSIYNKFINYINNKDFIFLNYNDNNSFGKNKFIINNYLKICNYLNITDKIESVINNNLNPMNIIYDELIKLSENTTIPELFDDSRHVSQQAENLAINTLNNYIDVNYDENELLNEFIKPYSLTSIQISIDTEEELKKHKLFSNLSNDELNSLITDIKELIADFKNKHEKGAIFYGWLFESLLCNQIKKHINKLNFDYKYSLSKDNCFQSYKKNKELLNNYLNEITTINETDEEEIKKYVVHILNMFCDTRTVNIIFDNTDTYILISGFRDIINEHKEINKNDLISIYKFFLLLFEPLDKKIENIENYLDLFIIYNEYILSNQVKHFIKTYIPTQFGGEVVDIEHKINFDYGKVKGEGDYILTIKKKNNDIIKILADCKCYKTIMKTTTLKFLYQLIGYNQQHKHKLLIPSYKKDHNYKFNYFMIINPLMNNTITYYTADINKHKKEVDLFADVYEKYIYKCLYSENQ